MASKQGVSSTTERTLMEQLWGLTLLGTVQWQLAFRCGAYAIGYSWPLGVGPTLLGTVQWQLAFRCGASRYWVLYNCSWPLGVGPHAIGYCTMAAGLTLLGTVQWQLAFRFGASCCTMAAGLSCYWVLYNGPDGSHAPCTIGINC